MSKPTNVSSPKEKITPLFTVATSTFASAIRSSRNMNLAATTPDFGRPFSSIERYTVSSGLKNSATSFGD